VNSLWLSFQYLLSAVAIPLGFNDKLNQFCDRCGRTNYACFWSANEVWEAVAGNVNGHRHGAYCVSCFDVLARRKCVAIQWTAHFPVDT
jgi:hypothetical protein